MIKRIVVYFAIAFGIFGVNFAGFNFRGVSSYVRVGAGSTFFLNKPLIVNNGAIIKDTGGTISGATLSFIEGVYTDASGSTALNGTLDPLGSFTLNGQTMNVSQGVQSIYVQGTGNRIEGSPRFISDVTLKDASTTLTCAIDSTVSRNIVLNGGGLKLDNNLSFASGYKIVGPGLIASNRYSVFLGGGNVTWDTTLTWSNAEMINMTGYMVLTNTWTFYGTNNKIEGNGNFLTLQGSGALVVAPGAALTLKGVQLVGVAGTNIRCADSTGTIVLDGCTWQQSGDYTFATGVMNYKTDVLMTGSGTKFIYQSGQQSQILSQSMLSLDLFFTFSYDPRVTPSKDRFSLADANSSLTLNGATFHVTGTGINFTKGSINLFANSIMESEKIGALDEGITLGDGISATNDCSLWLTGMQLTINTGSFKYKNISPNAVIVGALGGVLFMNTNTTLYLYQSMSINAGSVVFENNSTWASATGADIIGAISPLGILIRTVIP